MKRKHFTQAQIREALRTLVPPDASGQEADFSGSHKIQYDIIKNILNGWDVLAVMPTGGGKSVCFQVPAILLDGLTVVVTPLISLMQDQIETLRARDIPAACISGSMMFDGERYHYYNAAKKAADAGKSSDTQDPGNPDTIGVAETAESDEPASNRRIRNKIFLAASRGEYKLLYVTPERLKSGGFIRMAERANISLLAVDEAHCISMWGYDFRPQYLEIERMVGRSGQRPVIAAFTATATTDIQKDIRFLLRLQDPYVIPNPDFVRDNLSFRIERPGSAITRMRMIHRYINAHHLLLVDPDAAGILSLSERVRRLRNPLLC